MARQLPSALCVSHQPYRRLRARRRGLAREGHPSPSPMSTRVIVGRSRTSVPISGAGWWIPPHWLPARSKPLSRRFAGDVDAELAIASQATDGVAADILGADAIWLARKERIRELLADEQSSASDLKRELRRLLSYADSTRNAARHERGELAAGEGLVLVEHLNVGQRLGDLRPKVSNARVELLERKRFELGVVLLEHGEEAGGA